MFLEKDNVLNLKGFSFFQLKNLIDQNDEEFLAGKPGLYVWRYWPSWKNPLEDKEQFLSTITDDVGATPSLERNLRNKKINVNVKISPLNHFNGTNKNPFNLSQIGRLQLAEFLSSSQNLNEFKSCMDLFYSFLPPLYIGKADDLFERLKTHMERGTPLLEKIFDLNISQSNIFISALLVKDSSKEVLEVYETLLQRMCHPILSEYYGRGDSNE